LAYLISYLILGILFLVQGGRIFINSLTEWELLKQGNREEEKEEKKEYERREKEEKKENVKVKDKPQKNFHHTDFSDRREESPLRDTYQNSYKPPGISKYLLGLFQQAEKQIVIWGILLGFACVGEIALLEGLVASASLGALGESHALSILFSVFLGALAMFFFALGSAVPVIVVFSAAGVASRYTAKKRRRILMLIFSSSFMVFSGLALIMYAGIRLLAII
ncbi:MAG: hypothetical protein QW728_00235, partial [Thermoplasmata archaeon]